MLFQKKSREKCRFISTKLGDSAYYMCFKRTRDLKKKDFYRIKLGYFLQLYSPQNDYDSKSIWNIIFMVIIVNINVPNN